MRCVCLCHHTLLVTPFWKPLVHSMCSLCSPLLAAGRGRGAWSCLPGAFRTQGVGLKPNDLFGLAAGTSGCSGHRAQGTSPIMGQDLSLVCDGAAAGQEGMLHCD